MFAVRVWFTWLGQPVFDEVGPMDRTIAEIVCLNMAEGYLYGATRVHVERALIVPWMAA